MSALTTHLRAEEFAERSADAGSVELVRGEVIRLSPGGFDHSRISINLAAALHVWARRTKLGRVLSNEAGIITQRDPDTVRGADIAYISYQRIPRGQTFPGFTAVPPELIVEVVGRGQGWNDLVLKAGEYLHIGVLVVWIVDPVGRSVHVFRADRAPQRLLPSDALCDEQVLPGFSCPISDIFED